MRHATARTTLDTYDHLWPDADGSTRSAYRCCPWVGIQRAAYPQRDSRPWTRTVRVGQGSAA